MLLAGGIVCSRTGRGSGSEAVALDRHPYRFQVKLLKMTADPELKYAEYKSEGNSAEDPSISVRSFGRSAKKASVDPPTSWHAAQARGPGLKV